MTHRLNSHGQPIGPAIPDWVPPPAPPRTPVSGRFCRLEPLAPDRHANELHTANSMDPTGKNWTYLSYGPFETPEDYRAWLEKNCLGDDPLFYAIVDTANGKAVGVASYLRITPAHGSIEIGHLNFSPLLQRRPAATEAIYLLLQRAFELGYRRCEWKCDSLNARSLRAAERLGFRFEGVFRQAMAYKGRSRDTIWLSIIDSEWPALREAFQSWARRRELRRRRQTTTKPDKFNATGQTFNSDVGELIRAPAPKPLDRQRLYHGGFASCAAVLPG